MADYSTIMLEKKKIVEDSLSEFFRNKLAGISDPFILDIVTKIRDFTLNGGKRVRPILIQMGHDLYSRDQEGVVMASASIEILQTYLLIHDDIIDQSDYRRGKPSYHKQVEALLAERTRDARRIAENLAIVAGDLAESYAHQAILESGVPFRQAYLASLELTNIIEKTGYGQLVDIESPINDSFNEESLMKLHLWKTAKYTVEGPLRIGAILSGTEDDISDLLAYGDSLGVAFQLHDDIIGLFGEESVTGKSVKSDVNEGKKTLLMLKAIERSTVADAGFLKECLKSGNVSDTDFERLRNIVVSTGSLDYSTEMAAKLVREAKNHLHRIKGDPDVKKFLDWFADYLVSRKN